MKFRLLKQYGARNSQPVFDAFSQGIKSLGHEIVNDSPDFDVIWSVLWSGKMTDNLKIYQKSKSLNKPIIILEVGNLIRGKTWRVSLDNINGLGYFGNHSDLDLTRPKKLGLFLHDYRKNRRPEILIACQHGQSLQWDGMPSMDQWVNSKIMEIRQFTSRPIIVRPHPRSPFSTTVKGVLVEKPKKVPNTYDDYDIDYNYHCVVNHNSGPAVQAAIQGTPVICHSSSLAYEISENIENIENPSLPDRENWFTKLCHTEWTLPEIAAGIPLGRIINRLSI